MELYPFTEVTIDETRSIMKKLDSFVECEITLLTIIIDHAYTSTGEKFKELFTQLQLTEDVLHFRSAKLVVKPTCLIGEERNMARYEGLLRRNIGTTTVSAVENLLLEGSTLKGRHR